MGLWFSGAMCVRVLEKHFFRPNTPKAATAGLYVASIPVIYASIRVLPLLGVRAHEYNKATLIGIASAVLLDSTALVFAPRIYHSAAGDTGRAGAWILWGAAWSCISALVLQRDG